VGKLKTKFTRLEKTVTVGRTCGGNNTLVMRLPPLTIEFAPSKIEVEKHIQGRIPQNKNTGYFSTLILRKTENTIAYTHINRRGFRNVQRNPRTEP